jgi:hypothetical protein
MNNERHFSEPLRQAEFKSDEFRELAERMERYRTDVSNAKKLLADPEANLSEQQRTRLTEVIRVCDELIIGIQNQQSAIAKEMRKLFEQDEILSEMLDNFKPRIKH